MKPELFVLHAMDLKLSREDWPKDAAQVMNEYLAVARVVPITKTERIGAALRGAYMATRATNDPWWKKFPTGVTPLGTNHRDTKIGDVMVHGGTGVCFVVCELGFEILEIIMPQAYVDGLKNRANAVRVVDIIKRARAMTHTCEVCGNMYNPTAVREQYGHMNWILKYCGAQCYTRARMQGGESYENANLRKSPSHCGAD